MTAVFLDFATMGAGDLNPTPLYDVLPDLEIFQTTTAAETAGRIRDAEFVLTNKVRLNEDNMAGADRLRFIGLTATGTDNVDTEYCKSRGIAVANIRAYCTQSVVEHVFGVLLNLTHSLERFRGAVAAGHWQASEEFCMLDYPIRELSGMSLGIVGYGELGRGVARVGELFGMDVMISRRPGTRGEPDDGRIDFPTLLSIADVISLHCPLTDATRHLIGDRELAAMKDDAILINTARGALVDTAALARALADGVIGAAAVDVLPQEPPVDGDPLLDYDGDNLILTPHIAWATREARQNALGELAANVKAFLQDGSRNRVV